MPDAERHCTARDLPVGRRGLEPRTYGLKVRSSTIELATQGPGRRLRRNGQEATGTGYRSGRAPVAARLALAPSEASG